MDDESNTPAYEPPNDYTPPFVAGEFVRPKTPGLYRFSLVVVSLAMILLPLLYLAAVGFFGYAVYYYATHVKLPGSSHLGYRGSWLLMEIAYIFPLFVGSILFLFLIKPMFAPRPKESEHFSLDYADAPQLFSFIGWICRSLNAPIPSRIDVDCEINASAGFRNGFRSMFGNDLVLTIGLPLVAGMNINQLGGVIAHEYGHFAQGSAMRASFIIRQINFWLFRVVYQRDSWDDWLVQASEETDQPLRGALFFYLARGGVWLSRRVPWVLFWVGHLLSSYMGRQMEFDADRYQVKMSGSAGTVSARLRLHQMLLGQESARQQLRAKWKKDKKLFDQIPNFIISRANEIPAETQRRHYARSFKMRTGLFDWHPSDAARIAEARAANEPGILHSTEPARTLFTNFPELSRRATVLFYQDLIGPEFSPDWLVATEPTVAPADYDYTADRENLSRFCLGVATNLRPIFISENNALVFRSQETLVAEIRSCRESMQQSLPGVRESLAAFIQADARWLQLSQAACLSHAGFAIDPAEFNLPDGDLDGAKTEAARALQSAAAALQSFDDLAKVRLSHALQMLRLPQFAASLPESVQLKDHAKEMVFVLSRMPEVHKSLLELRTDCFALDALLRYRRQHGSADNLVQTIEAVIGSLQSRIKEIQQVTGQIRYPFTHTVHDAFVSDFARNKEYVADPQEAVLREASSHIEKLFALHERLLSNLVQIAEKVESHAGL